MQGQPRPWWHKWLAGSDRNERVKNNFVSKWFHQFWRLCFAHKVWHNRESSMYSFYLLTSSIKLHVTLYLYFLVTTTFLVVFTYPCLIIYYGWVAEEDARFAKWIKSRITVRDSLSSLLCQVWEAALVQEWRHSPRGRAARNCTQLRWYLCVSTR